MTDLPETFCKDVNDLYYFFFFQAEDGIRDYKVTGVQTCALPIFISFTDNCRCSKASWSAICAHSPSGTRRCSTGLPHRAGMFSPFLHSLPFSESFPHEATFLHAASPGTGGRHGAGPGAGADHPAPAARDRKSTRLNSSHLVI